MSISLASVGTVPAYPLGQPVDGRKRYGMTPEQAAVYRWLVENRPHKGSFNIQYRDVALSMAATDAFQRGDFAVAIGYWERALAALPPDSEMSRAIRGSLEQARQASAARSVAPAAASPGAAK
jgi:hypothetical protein